MVVPDNLYHYFDYGGGRTLSYTYDDKLRSRRSYS
jgi:hypothetical protein